MRRLLAFAACLIIALCSVPTRTEAQVQGVTETQLKGRVRTFTAGQSFDSIPAATITTATITTATVSGVSTLNGNISLVGPQLSSFTPNADAAITVGQPTKRISQVAAREVRAICDSGGPASTAGSTFCIDLDDLDSTGRPTVKMLLDGQVVYLAWSATKP